MMDTSKDEYVVKTLKLLGGQFGYEHCMSILSELWRRSLAAEDLEGYECIPVTKDMIKPECLKFADNSIDVYRLVVSGVLDDEYGRMCE